LSRHELNWAIFPAMQPDRFLSRLRWITLCVIIIDVISTLSGQPHSYWHKPSTAVEANSFTRIFLAQGYTPYAFWVSLYLASIAIGTRFLPKKLSLMVLLAVLFGHYFGASTWLEYHFKMGIQAPIVYGCVLAVLLVAVGFDAEPVSKTKEDRSDVARV
jgi:hypothetical protein